MEFGGVSCGSGGGGEGTDAACTALLLCAAVAVLLLLLLLDCGRAGSSVGREANDVCVCMGVVALEAVVLLLLLMLLGAAVAAAAVEAAENGRSLACWGASNNVINREAQALPALQRRSPSWRSLALLLLRYRCRCSCVGA